MKKVKKIKIIMKKIVRVIIISILIVVILYNFLNLISLDNVIGIFNYKIMVVEKYQEQKNIENNTLIIAKDIKGKYKENDLVIINLNKTLYIHRIIEIKNQTKYITKGDGNYKANKEIEDEQIEGKVIKTIPYLGAILKIIRTRLFSFFIIITLIIVGMYNKHLYKRQINRRIRKEQQRQFRN